MTIEPTRFIDSRDGTETLGVRVYDDYEQAYDDAWESIPNDDMEVIRKVAASSDGIIKSMLNYVRQNETGLYVGAMWYEWNKIKSIFDPEFA